MMQMNGVYLSASITRASDLMVTNIGFSRATSIGFSMATNISLAWSQTLC